MGGGLVLKYQQTADCGRLYPADITENANEAVQQDKTASTMVLIDICNSG